MQKTADAIAAECEVAGKTAVYTCANGCGKTEGGATIDPLGHEFADTFTVDTKATCTTLGSKSKHCTRCSMITDVTEIPAREHKLVDTDVAKAATCTADGTMNQKCTNVETAEYEACSETTTRVIPATGHTYVNASCDASGKCTVCGIETGSALGHDYKFDERIAPTCTNPGYDLYKCSRCEATDKRNTTDPAHRIITVSAKAPTCTEPGYEAYEYCSLCNYTTKGAETPATNHKYALTDTKDATCFENGLKTYMCSVCDNSYTEVIKARGSHTIGERKFTAATCTTAGTSYVLCGDCGEKYDVRNYDPMGHNFSAEGEFAYRIEATCEQEGAIYRTCTRCGINEDVPYRVLPAKDHYYFIYSDSVAPTCETPGYTQAKACLDCGLEIEPEIIPALGHSANKDGQCERCDSLMSEDGSVCTCMCHKTTFFGKLIYKIVGFFWKLFKINPGCDCGAIHY